MFLKIATVFAILGLLLGLLLSLIQQVIAMGFLHLPNQLMIFRFLNFAQALCLSFPLIIFLVAFLVSLRARQS
jgi:hypothetical protein